MDSAQLREALESWFRTKLDAPGVVLSPLTKPTIGFSNDTLICYVTYSQAGRERREDLVVRLEPADFQIFPEYDLPGQARIMRGLAGTDVPVPNVKWVEEDVSVVGRAFYVMDRIAGEVPSEVPPYHATGVFADAIPADRKRMWWSGIETLAKIHAVDWRSSDLALLGTPSEGTPAIRMQLDYYERMLDWAEEEQEPQTVLRTAQAWLRQNEPRSTRVGLCWGDSRLPNVIYRDRRIVGVLDWEMAFLGDPEADVAWWLFMDWFASGGYGLPRLEGMPAEDETIERYQVLTGRPFQNLEYFRVFAAMRFGVIMVRVVAMMPSRGYQLPAPDFASNNPVTRKLAEILGLPPPSETRA
jgi:aminoglycoside phosphotransferase (APT) family kinase protein